MGVPGDDTNESADQVRSRIVPCAELRFDEQANTITDPPARTGAPTVSESDTLAPTDRPTDQPTDHPGGHQPMPTPANDGARRTLPPPVASGPSSGRGPRWVTGVAVGALVGAVVSGGIVTLVDRNEDTTAPAEQPAVTTPQSDIASLVADVRPSIVAIHDSVTQTDIFGRIAEGQAAGTGFVLSTDGYIATNDHVIEGATDVTVDFSDGTTADATIVAGDPRSDLAVLKVDRTDLTPLPLGSSADLQVGEQLVAIGNALDLSGEPTVTTGIVSATGRSLTEPNGVKLVNLIQTDTAINPGNSGGPLLDMNGEVVGINTAIAGQAQNVGFAIAIDHAMRVIDDLRNGELPDHALLGVITRPAAGRDGVEIVDVSPDSAAADVDLRVGDVILEVDDDVVANPDELATIVAEHQPGDRVAVVFERDGRAHTVTVALGVRPTDG
jgi:putative serine protease PepD